MKSWSTSKTSLLMRKNVRRTVRLIQQNQELSQQCTLARLDLIVTWTIVTIRIKKTRTCFICKRQGHLKKDCAVWKARTEQEPRLKHMAKNAVTIPDSEKGISHGCFTIGIGESTNEWFIDSGLTTYMTNNLDFFEVIDQTKTDKISIANGTVIDADGVGDGYLNCTLDDGTIHRIKVEKVL